MQCCGECGETMTPVLLKSPARITLSLDIVKKLPNDLHEMSILKQTINLHDDIELRESSETQVSYENAPIDNDIVLKMIRRIKKQYKIHKNVGVHIKKNIPLGSGLAGGSSNAATVLKALNTIWNLQMSTDQLIMLCRRIGQDCAYFIYGGACYDTEAGLTLKPLPPLPRHYVLLVYPGFTCPTNKMYASIDYDEVNAKQNTLKILLKYKQPDFDITKHLHNDFEPIVFKKYPQLQTIKKELQHHGFSALLTGSGSTIFAISREEKPLKKIYEAIKPTYSWVHFTHTL